MITFGIVGVGWRAEFYLRIALACPDCFRVAGVVGRRPAKLEAFTRKFDVRSFNSIEELVNETNPLFVVSSVNWESNPEVIEELVKLGIPVLSETPPARTIAEMDELWDLVRGGAKIQVAEQYFLQPHHAARLVVAHGGKLGRITQAQVSAAHGYHGISLIRRFLGIGFEDVRISAKQFNSQILKVGGHNGPPTSEEMVTSKQILAYMDFGDRLGVFDFTDEQYFGETRNTRILVRGERGEIVTDTVAYMKDPSSPIHMDFVRHEAGQHGNLEGLHLKGIQFGEDWVYRNPVTSSRLYDDEIAIADCLIRMAEYVVGGPELYSLAAACQDRYLDMLIQKAVETGEVVESSQQSWTTL